MAEESNTERINEMAKMLSDMELAKLKKEALESMNLVVSAVRCSYCSKLYNDDDERNMGFESTDWAVCFKCFRNFCDAMLNEKTGDVK